MPGSAVLGSNLVDDLVPTVDELRSSLHDEFGVRQFHVYTVLREWSGGATGDGDPTDTETELTPKPKVEPYKTQYELETCGIDEAGVVMLREISLTYTEAEIIGPTLTAGQEWFIKITDAQGQAIADRYWVIAKPPFPDREKDIGWKVELRLVD